MSHAASPVQHEPVADLFGLGEEGEGAKDVLHLGFHAFALFEAAGEVGGHAALHIMAILKSHVGLSSFVGD